MRIDQAEQHVDKDQHRQHVQRPVQEQAEHWGSSSAQSNGTAIPASLISNTNASATASAAITTASRSGFGPEQHAKRLDQPFRQGPGELKPAGIVAGDPQPERYTLSSSAPRAMPQAVFSSRWTTVQQRHRGFGQEGRRRL